MKKETRWISAAGAGALAILFVAGCTGADQDGDGKTADSTEGAAIQNTVDSGQKAAADAGNAAANAASKAGQTVVNGAKNLDDAAVTTPKVKSALGANAALNGSNINVSTTDKNVFLEGTVKTAAQKTLAVQIAKKNAAGYTVVDKLKVG